MPHHELHDEHLEPDVVDEHDVVITEDEVDDEAHEYDEMLHVVLPDEYEVHESSDIEVEVEVVNEIKLDADLTDEETEYDVIILDVMLLTTDEDEVEQDVQPNDDHDVND